MIEGVAYEGGGVLGIAYVGALEAVESGLGLDWDVGVRVAAGTSAGSLMAAAIPARASSKKLKRVLSSVPWGDFEDNSAGVIRDLWNLWSSGGWNRNDAVVKWVEGYVDTLYPEYGESVTLYDIYMSTGVKLFIDAVDEQNGRHVRLGPDSHPHLRLVDALMASISIQFWFPPYEINGVCYSDGGLVSNHPVDALEEQGILPENSMGFRLVGDPKVRPVEAPKSPVARAKNLIRILVNHARQSHVPEEYWPYVVKIPTGAYSATDFDLTYSQQAVLREAGYLATENWIRRSNEHE